MDIIHWILALWIIAGFVVAVLFGVVSDSVQHYNHMHRAARRARTWIAR